MLISEVYASKYLKSNDLGGQRHVLTIMSVTLEEVSDGEAKPVMRFVGQKKGIVLNRTNSAALAQAFGDETINWQNQRIELMALPVLYQGKQVLGLVTLPLDPLPQQPNVDISQPAPIQERSGASGPHDLGSATILQPGQEQDLAELEADLEAAEQHLANQL